MLFDIFALAIVIITALLGFKNGAFYTIYRLFGWLIAGVGAYFARPHVVDFITKHTTIFYKYTRHTLSISNKFVDKYAANADDTLPDAIFSAIHDKVSGAITDITNNIASSTFSIIIFILLLLVFKLALYCITFLFSKRYSGFIGGFDGVAGFIVGLVQGAVIVLVVFSLLLLGSFNMGPKSYKSINDTMEKSRVAKFLYENNPINWLVPKFSAEDILPASVVEKKDNSKYEMKDWKNLV